MRTVRTVAGRTNDGRNNRVGGFRSPDRVLAKRDRILPLALEIPLMPPTLLARADKVIE
jgi:hypothetical protein